MLSGWLCKLRRLYLEARGFGEDLALTAHNSGPGSPVAQGSCDDAAEAEQAPQPDCAVGSCGGFERSFGFAVPALQVSDLRCSSPMVAGAVWNRGSGNVMLCCVHSGLDRRSLWTLATTAFWLHVAEERFHGRLVRLNMPRYS